MEFMEIISLILDAIITAAVAFIFKRLGALAGSLDESRKAAAEADKRNREFEMSMQQSEIIHAFQRYVEDGKPMSLEEATHLDKCYEAYHANGGNSVGTLLYERTKQYAKIVTKIDEGGTE